MVFYSSSDSGAVARESGRIVEKIFGEPIQLKMKNCRVERGVFRTREMLKNEYLDRIKRQ
jgi:hypothetical protein